MFAGKRTGPRGREGEGHFAGSAALHWPVERIAAAVEPLVFDRIYGGWFDRTVPADAKAVVARSAARYVRALRCCAFDPAATCPSRRLR